MIVSSGAPPVKSPLLRSMTLGMKQMKTGAPGTAAWMAHTELSASAMPTTSEPAMVIGVVEPPIGMVTKPIGMPASAKIRPASSVPSSLPSGVTVPSRALIGGSARSFSSEPLTASAIRTATSARSGSTTVTVCTCLPVLAIAR